MQATNRIIAKASRIEVARRWLSPAPERLVAKLLEQGAITQAEADLAKEIPMAEDLIAEADSGGHTDNRPAITMMPTFLSLRSQLVAEFGYERPIRIGCAGGISTPASAAAAFAMGADFLVTGSINQACLESGSSDIVRGMLAETEQADVIMAPAADMFEMGVKLQVLRRGTMFAMRAEKLYELYRSYPSVDAIPADERVKLEKTVFKQTLDAIWQETVRFFGEREPKQLERANQDPKHKMALIFRWYLGKSSRWANAGQADRRIDFQVWCGPAMGAFNEWTKGTWFADVANRKVADVALALLHSTAIQCRANNVRQQGVELPSDLIHIAPPSAAVVEGLRRA